MSSTELLDLMDQMIADTLATGRTEYIYADQSVAKSLQVRLQKRCKRLKSAAGEARVRWLTPVACEGGYRLVGVLGVPRGIPESEILAGRVA